MVGAKRANRTEIGHRRSQSPIADRISHETAPGPQAHADELVDAALDAGYCGDHAVGTCRTGPTPVVAADIVATAGSRCSAPYESRGLTASRVRSCFADIKTASQYAGLATRSRPCLGEPVCTVTVGYGAHATISSSRLQQRS